MAPLAGRPPFATDIPDSAYAQSQPQARYRPPPRDDPNARTSAYDHYDAYLNGNNGDSNSRTHAGHAAPATAAQFVPRQMPVPLAAPKPGYAAPIAALSIPEPSSPNSIRSIRFPPGISPVRTQHDQYGAPRMPPAATMMHPPPVAPISVPSTPHPLPPTMTPILPVFARPSKPPQSQDIKWGPEPILRGNSEERLLPRRGEKGDDFWRRFSMVARAQNSKPKSQKQSAWLRKNQSGTTRLAIWVWLVGLIVFSCAGLGIGLGWYIAHKSPSHQDPTVIGGGPRNSAVQTSSSAALGAGASTGATASPHVTPTHTLARRADFPDPSSTSAPDVPIHAVYIDHPHGAWFDLAPSRHQRRRFRRAVA